MRLIFILLIINILACQSSNKSDAKDTWFGTTEVEQAEFPKKLSKELVWRLMEQRNSILTNELLIDWYLEVYGDTTGTVLNNCSLVRMCNLDTDSDLEIVIEFSTLGGGEQYGVLDWRNNNWWVWRPIYDENYYTSCNEWLVQDKLLIIKEDGGHGSNAGGEDWEFYRTENNFEQAVFHCQEYSYEEMEDDNGYLGQELSIKGSYQVLDNTNRIQTTYIYGLNFWYGADSSRQLLEIPTDTLVIDYVWNEDALEYLPTSIPKMQRKDNLDIGNRDMTNVQAFYNRTQDKQQRAAIQKWLDSQTEK